MRGGAIGLLLLALPGLAAPVPVTGPASLPLPGGVADAEGKVGFVTGADGSINSLDLATGKVRWSSKLAQRAVAVEAQRVLCLANNGNKLEVVALDVADGKKLATSDAVTFPEWVVVLLGPVTSDAGRSFQHSVIVDKGDLYLRWRAASWYWGGARPSPEIETAARKNAEGVARVNLKTGKADAVGVEHWPGDVKVSAEVEKVAARAAADAFGQRRVRVVGDLAVVVETEDNKVVLKRWQLNDAKALEPVTLVEGAAFQIEIAQVAGRVLIHPLPSPFATPPGVVPWYVFDLATGKQVGKLEFTPTTREATVVGPRVFCVVPAVGSEAFSNPRLLRAVDIASGKTLWDHGLQAERRSPPPP